MPNHMPSLKMVTMNFGEDKIEIFDIAIHQAIEHCKTEMLNVMFFFFLDIMTLVLMTTISL